MTTKDKIIESIECNKHLLPKNEDLFMIYLIDYYLIDFIIYLSITQQLGTRSNKDTLFDEYNSYLHKVNYNDIENYHRNWFRSFNRERKLNRILNGVI